MFTLPSIGKLDISPSPARWYGNTGFSMTVGTFVGAFDLFFDLPGTHKYEFFPPGKNSRTL